MTQKDILGAAIVGIWQGNEDEKLHLHTSYGPVEEMPLEIFFRELDEMTELEVTAIEACRGSVLDLGAGAGCFAALLQQMEFEVHALDNSAGCAKVLHERGVQNVHQIDLYEYKAPKVNTVLIMMNGLGLAGKLENVVPFFDHLRQLLEPGGRIVVDSSDISYMYKRGSKPKDRYFGEVQFRFEYAGEMGEWFDWVYVDYKTLCNELTPNGWNIELLHQNKLGEYLVRIESSQNNTDGLA
jgi:precorrin-6B methylase 2